MALKFFYSGKPRKNLALANGENGGNRQKKSRTEDLDLSAVIRIASETTAAGHEGGSDAELSGDEFYQPRSNCSEPEDFFGDGASSHTDDDGSNSEMYLFHSTPQRQLQRPESSRSSSSCSNASSGPSVADMIQKQNMLIMELLKKHESLCDTVASVRDDLNETKIQISRLAEKENQVPVAKGRKRAYPNALSEALFKVHEKSEIQFNPAVSSTDKANVDVKQMLMTEIRDGCHGRFTDEQISLAIRRLYEGIRRQHLNHRPENMQKAQEHDLKKKYRARRERLHARRSKYVPAKYRRKWELLNIHYMSEEEDGPDGTIVVKKLPWRSEKLNRLMAALDTAADKVLSSSEAFTPERKKRVISDVPSSLVPPTDAPEWAIKSDSNCGTNGKGDSEVSTLVE